MSVEASCECKGEATREVPSVMICSGDRDFRISLGMMLLDFFDVFVFGAEDLESFERVVSRGAPDVLIIDTPPSASLLASIARLRAAQPTLLVFLFFVSPFNDPALNAQMERVVNAVFYKPIDPLELIGQIRRLTERRTGSDATRSVYATMGSSYFDPILRNIASGNAKSGSAAVVA